MDIADDWFLFTVLLVLLLNDVVRVGSAKGNSSIEGCCCRFCCLTPNVGAGTKAVVVDVVDMADKSGVIDFAYQGKSRLGMI